MDEESIFAKAIEIQSAAQRASYLDRVCGENRVLRNRIENLIGSHKQTASFLDEPAGGTIIAKDVITEQIGTTVGPYKLREVLGNGGMGVVYAAEQRQPVRRRVALKIIKPGMDTREVIGRFESERQALAMMDHPNIARVLDAGATPNGHPFFVMELIRGVSITEYCDEQKCTVDERLRLFVQVCRAVQHAHQKGLIHRDLKPSNVMITLHDGAPVPKVIDFGIAKAMHQPLTDGTVYTKVSQILGTPVYMSPEQSELSGLDIDTRSDIYSLGVILYELLTCSTPFRQQDFSRLGLDEIRRIIRETDPQRPSDRISTLGAEAISTISAHRKDDRVRLIQSLRGDLDWIVMKALEKDRRDRYETANDLAADILRHLNDEPVSAGPPSTRYRMKKFVRRNRVAVIACSLVAIALLLGVVGTTSGLLWALNERDRTAAALKLKDEALQETRETIGKYVATVQNEELLKEERFKPLMKTLLKDSLEHYERFISQHEHSESMLSDLVDAVFSVGEISERSGNSQKAMEAYQHVIELGERLKRNDPTNTSRVVQLSAAHNNLGTLYLAMGQLTSAVESFQCAIDIAEKLAGEYPKTVEYQVNVALFHNNIGEHYRANGQPNKAIESLRRAQTILDKVANENPGETKYIGKIAGIHYGLGHLISDTGRLDEALREYQSALTAFGQLAGPDLVADENQYILVKTYHNIGALLYNTGKVEEAVQSFQKSLAINNRLATENPTIHSYQSELMTGLTSLGQVYANMGKAEDAFESYQRALVIGKQLVDENPTVNDYHARLGQCHYTLALLQYSNGQNDDALTSAQRTRAIFERLVKENVTNAEYRSQLAQSLNICGVVFAELGQSNDALDLYLQAISIRESLVLDYPSSIEFAVGLGGSYCNAANLAQTSREFKRAESLYDKGIETLTHVTKKFPEFSGGKQFLHNSYSNRAILMEKLKRFDEAAADWDNAGKTAPDGMTAVYKKRRDKAAAKGKIKDDSPKEKLDH